MSGLEPLPSSDEEHPTPSNSLNQPSISDRDDEDSANEGPFTFRRNMHNNYLSVSIISLIRM